VSPLTALPTPRTVLPAALAKFATTLARGDEATLAVSRTALPTPPAALLTPDRSDPGSEEGRGLLLPAVLGRRVFKLRLPLTATLAATVGTETLATGVETDTANDNSTTQSGDGVVDSRKKSPGPRRRHGSDIA
jgi:hypothetical protein